MSNVEINGVLCECEVTQVFYQTQGNSVSEIRHPMRNRHFKFYLESSSKGPGLLSTVFVLDSSGELHLGPEVFSRKKSYLLD